MSINDLLQKFSAHKDAPAIIWENKTYTYDWLIKSIEKCEKFFDDNQLKPNLIVELRAEFSPQSVSVLIALIKRKCIIMPISPHVKGRDAFREIAQVESVVEINQQDEISLTVFNLSKTPHSLIQTLIIQNKSGLILWSSGSTGKSKAVLHDFEALLEKFKKPRLAKRIITFLLFDHIGGINTLFYTLFNGGCVIALQDRTPQTICEAIAKHKAQVLPTSPTFLNLLLLTRAYKKYNFESLELITYGTEVMPEKTLSLLTGEFPHIKFQQTYGLSEIGILSSKSKSSDSLFMKIGGDHYQTRIVNGMLEVKAAFAMLGYLNAPSPFTQDGWFKTNDIVEQDGEYIRILGRESDIINVGGEKVFPIEIENVIQQIPNVQEVAITSEPHPLTGQIVKAIIQLSTPEDPAHFRMRLRKFCKNKLTPYKIPQKIIVTHDILHNERFKKIRNITPLLKEN